MHSAQDVFRLTWSAAKEPSEANQDAWQKAVSESDPRTLVAATALLTSDPDHLPAVIKALREAIISEIERKNTDRLIATMEKLDQSAGRLAWITIVLTAMAAFLAVVPVLQAFGVMSPAK